MLGDGKKKSSWLLAGLGLGALAGVLFTPKSGCETRKAIAAGVDGGLEYLTTFGRDIREGANKTIDVAKRILKRAA